MSIIGGERSQLGSIGGGVHWGVPWGGGSILGSFQGSFEEPTLYFFAVIMHNLYYRQQHQWSENKFTHFWKQDEQFTNYKYKESPASAVSISTVLAVPGLVRFGNM